MEEHNKRELEHIINKVRDPDTTEEELIGILADILVEVILWQLEGKVEKPKVEKRKKSKIDPEKKFHY